jgi:hypothetical protein
VYDRLTTLITNCKQWRRVWDRRFWRRVCMT